ncbi:ribose 5-phosphate isomerase B [Erysipelothrix urinaevulpis]|uniref:ribose 5-phosphate isomerase B n=1 Tax=Erysipelothrix urinaevulpis TaxID=2683717 RepID=UPI00135C8114|nr:ribose 5-phosphate isomerase B [Erysipelothrix urinaevulpis]
MKKISLASDHGGYEQKEAVKNFLLTEGYEVKDFGVYSEESQDYSDFIYPAAKAVADKEVDCGIILCGTGIGASITANKVRGIRCALVTSVEVAQLTREHNDSNVLALAGRTTDLDTNLAIVKTWLDTEFSHDERHERRIDKISKIEDKENR